MKSHAVVGGVTCRIVQWPVPYQEAHPDEPMDGICERCARVEHPTFAHPVLVWGLPTGDFSLSRNDPMFALNVASWPSTP